MKTNFISLLHYYCNYFMVIFRHVNYYPLQIKED